MSKTRISNIETIEFPSTCDGALVTTRDLMKKVNSFFSNIFSDYKGCNINVDINNSDPNDPQAIMNANHPVSVDLFFTPSNDEDENRIKAFEIISGKKVEKSSSGKMNYLARVNAYNNAMTENKTTCITQDAVDILYNLLWYEIRRVVPENCSPKNFNDRGISVETSAASTDAFGNVSSKVVYGVVRYIDINEILHLIYGNDKASRCFYKTTPIRPIVPMYAGMNPANITVKWILLINRMNENNMRDVLNELGTTPAVGPTIYTDK